MNNVHHVLIFSLFAILSSCEKSGSGAFTKKNAHHINGQVFVIQKNRVNVKLGGVKIYFVPLDQVRSRLTWVAVNQEKSKYALRYEDKLEKIDEMINSVSKRPFALRFEGFVANSQQIQRANWNKFERNALVQDFRRMSLLQEENSEIFNSSDFAGLPEQQWAIVAIFFEWLDRTMTSETVTDADGNYSLEIPAATRGFIFSESSRQLNGGKFEHYFWMQEVSGSEKAPVHLTSVNTLQPTTFAEIIRQSSETPRTSMRLIEDEFGLANLEWFDDASAILREATTRQHSVDSLKIKIKNLEGKIEEIKILSDP